MNKKLIALLLISLLIFAGCRTAPAGEESKPASSEPVSTESEATDPSDQALPETIPGLVYSPNNDGNLPDDSIEVDGTTPTKPEETTKPQEPSEPIETTQPTVPSEPELTSYEQYNAMSPEEQYAFFCTFDSMEDFVAWYNAAKAEYDALHPDIDIGDGNIDIGDIIGKP